MRIPEHIKKKLHRIAWLHDRAGALMFEVERWLENNGFDLYQLRDGSGCGLEEFEY